MSCLYKEMGAWVGVGMKGMSSGFRYSPDKPGPPINWTSSPIGPRPQHKSTTQ